MYDFHFGTPAEIRKDEAKYLLWIKRLLPRWVNSIPDSEYLALHDLLSRHLPRKRPVIAETGAGASSLVLLFHALKRGGTLYTWDFIGPKGSLLREVASDTLGAYLAVPVSAHWRFIAYSSRSPQLGLSVLGELGERVDFCFLDSEHTWENLGGELEAVGSRLKDGAVVAIDDANYDFLRTNIAYINLLRKKLGLPPAPEPAGNRCRPFHVETEALLRGRWKSVEHLPDTFKREHRRDLSIRYQALDREVTAKAGMEKPQALDHRFDAWRVRGRRHA